MIRQARSYLAGAASSAALVGAAIAAFVLLASLQAFRDWPIPGLGDDSPVVALAGVPAPARDAARALAPATRPVARLAANRGRRAGNRAGNGPGSNAISPGAGNGPGGGSGSPGSGGLSDGIGGGPGSPSPPPSPVPTAPPAPPAPPEPGLQAPAVGPINSGSVQGNMNQTLQQAGGAGGGLLDQTGVPATVQGVTNGVLGPSTPTGQVIDNTLGTADGVLHGPAPARP